MTTIQKFEEALEAPEGKLDVLNASEDVVVMVDEAPSDAVRHPRRALCLMPCPTQC